MHTEVSLYSSFEILVILCRAVVTGIGLIKFMSPGELNKSFFGPRRVGDAGRTKKLRMSLTLIAKMSDRGDVEVTPDSWRPLVVPLLLTDSCQFGNNC